MLRRGLLGVALMLIVPWSLACDGTSTPSPEVPDETGNSPSEAAQIDKIVYRFNDASVPPPHHRSFTITVTPTSVLEVVDSYGDEVSRRDRELGEREFARLVKQFESIDPEPQDKGSRAAPGCTGGTSEDITVFAGDSEQFAGSIEHCGGKDSADFRGELGPFITAVRASVAG